MRLELEQGQGAALRVLHGEWSGGAKAGSAGSSRGGGARTWVTKTLARLSWTAGGLEPGVSHRRDVPELGAFAGAKRQQLAALTEAGVLAGLREQVTGVTRLASLRPYAPRLTVARIGLARASTEAGGAPERDLGAGGVDEGGIYSW